MAPSLRELLSFAGVHRCCNSSLQQVSPVVVLFFRAVWIACFRAVWIACFSAKKSAGGPQMKGKTLPAHAIVCHCQPALGEHGSRSAIVAIVLHGTRRWGLCAQACAPRPSTERWLAGQASSHPQRSAVGAVFGRGRLPREGCSQRRRPALQRQRAGRSSKGVGRLSAGETPARRSGEQSRDAQPRRRFGFGRPPAFS